MKKTSILSISLIISALILFSSCNKNMDPNRPIGAEGKRKKNIEEGRGASIGGLLGKVGKTTYEFSTSNPMWRASLETLDFLPFTTVDYSGGIIITDWYSDNTNSNESIKLTLRFLSNEIASNSIKVIVHKKKCSTNTDCVVKKVDSKITEELIASILTKASEFENQSKKKKK
jgi:hypothetical protein